MPPLPPIFGETLKSVRDQTHSAFTGAASLALAGGAVAGLHQAATKVYDAATKSRDYNRMLEVHPNLREHDPVKLERAFTTLRTFNPAFSKDPLVAGAAVSQLVEFPNAAAGFAGELLGSASRMPVGFEAARAALEGGRAGMDLGGRHALEGRRQEHANALEQQRMTFQALQAGEEELGQQRRDDLRWKRDAAASLREHQRRSELAAVERDDKAMQSSLMRAHQHNLKDRESRNKEREHRFQAGLRSLEKEHGSLRPHFPDPSAAHEQELRDIKSFRL